MQFLPAAPEPSHHRAGRRGRKRHKHEERRESDRDVGTLRDVRDDGMQIERLVEDEINEKMQQCIGEGEQAEHSA